MKKPEGRIYPLVCIFGCDDAVVAVVHTPYGCFCAANKYQPRCQQHMLKLEGTDAGRYIIVEDFRIMNTPQPSANRTSPGGNMVLSTESIIAGHHAQNERGFTPSASLTLRAINEYKASGFIESRCGINKYMFDPPVILEAGKKYRITDERELQIHKDGEWVMLAKAKPEGKQPSADMFKNGENVNTASDHVQALNTQPSAEEVIERVAREICKVDDRDPGIDNGHDGWMQYQDYAKAALAAMPKPDVRYDINEMELRDTATKAMTGFVESTFIMKQNPDGSLSEQFIPRNDAIAMGWQVFYAVNRFWRKHFEMPSGIAGTDKAVKSSSVTEESGTSCEAAGLEPECAQPVPASSPTITISVRGDIGVYDVVEELPKADPPASSLVDELAAVLEECVDQLWHLAKNPDDNYFIKRGKAALARYEKEMGRKG